MPSPDQPTTSPVPGLPTPPSGVGASDLATESSDPQELRDLLERARERLAFYESFDRIIGENIRRSGELMVETVSLREQAQQIANQSARERAEFEATRQADRDRYRSLIQHALDEAASVRPVIDAMVEKLQGVLATLDNDTPEGSDAQVAAEPMTGANVATTADLVEPWSTSSEGKERVETPASEQPAPDTAPDAVLVGETAVTSSTAHPVENTTEPETPGEPAVDEAPAVAGPRMIDVLAHGVPNARIAISLQKMLRGLDVVSNVEAREFADGELRLAVTATDILPVDALSIWLTDNQGELTSSSDTVTEITFNQG